MDKHYVRMKKKMTLLFVAVFCCTSAAWAFEPIKFGLKFGIQGQSANMNILQNMQSISSLASEGRLGYQFGAMARINLPVVYFQPELVYGISRFTMNGANNASVPYNMRTLDVPVLVGAKVWFARVFAGPTFNLMTETRIKGSELGGDFSTTFRRSTVGFQVGLGVEFLNRLNLDVRYGGQFRKPVQEIIYNGNPVQEVKTGINAWQINLGYFF